METCLKELSHQIGVTLTQNQILNFMTFQNRLLEWNQKMNLTAITDNRDIVLKHFIDSLTIKKYLPLHSHMIDVGTGAGFPGIPLKIVRDDINITLLDSLNKRLMFLEEVVNSCHLENVQLVHGRAEDVGNQPLHREKYDIATARAVANLATLSELCLPFVKVGGKFIAMKGSQKEEIEEAKYAISILGGKIETIDEFLLPDSDIVRQIIVISKIQSTPKEYPRKAGTPNTKPLIK